MVYDYIVIEFCLICLSICLLFKDCLNYSEAHPLKRVSEGLPVIVAPIVLYSDNFSGNRSKKWNKFDAWCMALAGLLKVEARQFCNIHFIACSNKVTTMEMTYPLADDLSYLEKGLKMYDACSRREVYVIAPVLCVLCDNVRASELLNHLGSKVMSFLYGKYLIKIHVSSSLVLFLFNFFRLILRTLLLLVQEELKNLL